MNKTVIKFLQSSAVTQNVLGSLTSCCKFSTACMC